MKRMFGRAAGSAAAVKAGSARAARIAGRRSFTSGRLRKRLAAGNRKADSKSILRDTAPGGFLCGVMGFVSQHPFLGATRAFAFLAADSFALGAFGGHEAVFDRLDFVEQQPAGDEAVEALLPRGLTLDL